VLVKLDLDGDCDLSKLPGRVVDVERSYSGGCHVLIDVDVDLKHPCAHILVAAALGSDLDRAILDLVRCISGTPHDRFFDTYCLGMGCSKRKR